MNHRFRPLFRFVRLFLPYCCWTACGSASPATTLVTSESTMEAHSESSPDDESPLDPLAERDTELAEAILLDALSDGLSDLSTLAAVYVRLVGLPHPEDLSTAALLHGTQSADPLIAALSWRWLVLADVPDLPPWSDVSEPRPEAAIFAFLAYTRRGDVPKPLTSALHAGNATALRPLPEEWRDLNDVLRAMDDGPLATAITFVAARRRELAGEAAEQRFPLAAALRGELLRYYDIPMPAGGFRQGTDTFPNSPLLRLLDSPLRHQPASTLWHLCLTGTDDLRLEALRILGARQTEPMTGDLAAAAAAMRSTNPVVRVEAARTWLLLLRRTLERTHGVPLR